MNNRYAKKGKEKDVLNPKIIDEKIKSGAIGGIYCFFGDEEYMIDHHIGKITDKAVKSGDGFDYAVFDADNFDLNLIRDMISSYPVMSDYKTAVIKYADTMKFKSGEKEGLVKILSEYKGDIRDYACVIFKMKSLSEPTPTSEKNAKTGAKRTGLSLTGFLRENAYLFECNENTSSSLIKWIKKIAASEHIEINDENAGYILSRSEMKMYPLKNELSKLICLVKAEGRNTISKEDIELLTAKKTETEAFELTNAILDKNYGKAIESLEKLKNLKEEPVVILGQISRHFSDLLPVNSALSSGLRDTAAISGKTGIHSYKIGLIINSLKRYKNPSEFIYKALNLCRECDLKLKSTQLPQYNLIENLLFNIAGL